MYIYTSGILISCDISILYIYIHIHMKHAINGIIQHHVCINICTQCNQPKSDIWDLMGYDVRYSDVFFLF